MSDLSNYRNQVAVLGKEAVAAEEIKDWQTAYEKYVSALNIFKHMIKYEKNTNLQQIYIDKMKMYLNRAEYIKKTALNKPDHQIAPTVEPEGDGSTGTAPAKKKEKKEGDDDENKKM